jgi:uncharacterized protein (TIGR00255 family)
MMRSMTAYGRAYKSTQDGNWTIELHSVNRKGLDLNLTLPQELLTFDPQIRKWLSEEIHRGQVTLRVMFEPRHFHTSVQALKAAKTKWEAIAQEVGFSPSVAIDFRFLVEQMQEMPQVSDGKELEAGLFKTLSEAVKKLIEMRAKEGRVLAQDFAKRLKVMRLQLKKVEQKTPMLQEKYKNRLQKRIDEVVSSQDEERILREVMIYAERVDIAEEITRLKSHMTQFENLLKSKEKSIGRTLDFLAQEMGREANTLTAKAGDAEISRLAITLKSEVEKIREQVQNVE